MQIETLKVFCDLVESQSFSQSAIRNFITQSAVSQQVRNLEARFDTPLLIRNGRSVTPTTSGRILYEAAREILDRFERMQSEIKSSGSEMSGSVKVATIYTVGLYEMSMVIKTFLKAYPKVNLEVEYLRANRVYEYCQRGLVDIGVVTYPQARKGIRTIPLPSDRLVLICPPDHLFARRRNIELGRLDGENFVSFTRDLPSRRALDKVLRDHKVKVRTVMEFDNIETIKRSVEIGAGVAIVPLMSVQREVQSGTLAQVQFKGESFYRPLAILVRQNREVTPAAQKFIDLMTHPKTEL